MMLDWIVIIMVLGVVLDSNQRHALFCSALPTQGASIKETVSTETSAHVLAWQTTSPGSYPGVLTSTEIGNKVNDIRIEGTDQNSATIIGEQNRNDRMNRYNTISHVHSETGKDAAKQDLRSSNAHSTMWRKKRNMDHDYSSEDSIISEHGPFPGHEIATNTMEKSTPFRTTVTPKAPYRIQAALGSIPEANTVSESTSYDIKAHSSSPYTISSAASDSDAIPVSTFTPDMTPASVPPSETKMTSTSYSLLISVYSIQDVLSTPETSSTQSALASTITIDAISGSKSTRPTVAVFETKSDVTTSQISADEFLRSESTPEIVHTSESTSDKIVSVGTFLEIPMFQASKYTPEIPLESVYADGIIPISDSLADTFKPSMTGKDVTMGSKFTSDIIPTQSLTPKSSRASDLTHVPDALLSSESPSVRLRISESKTEVTAASPSATSAGTISNSESKAKPLPEFKSITATFTAVESSTDKTSTLESNQEITLKLQSTPDPNFISESAFYRKPSLESTFDEFLRNELQSDATESRPGATLGSESPSYGITPSESTRGITLGSNFSRDITLASNSISDNISQPIQRTNSASQGLSEITQRILFTPQSTTHLRPASESIANIEDVISISGSTSVVALASESIPDVISNPEST